MKYLAENLGNIIKDNKEYLSTFFSELCLVLFYFLNVCKVSTKTKLINITYYLLHGH